MVTLLIALTTLLCGCSAHPSAGDEAAGISFRKSEQRLGNTRPFGAVMADVDMDGDNDVFLTNYIGPSTLWLNDGRGNFTVSQQEFGNSEAHDVALQDLNGDHSLDLNFNDLKD